MAKKLTREELIDLGVDESVIDAIMARQENPKTPKREKYEIFLFPEERAAIEESWPEVVIKEPYYRRKKQAEAENEVPF